LAIAYTNQGYSNLVRLTSWAWIHGYYRRPRVNHDVLKKYKEGLIFTSTCANSEIANALFKSGEDAAYQMLEHYMAMFAPNFYLELMMLDFKLQKPYNEFLIKAHDKYHLPIIITQDCHYCRREHSHNQRLMLMQQNKRTLADIQAMIDAGEAEDLFELQDSNLWLKSEDEMNEKWEQDYKDNIPYEIYQQAKANTVKVCEMAKGVEIDRTLKLPKLPNCNEELWEEIKKGFIARRCPRTQEYSKRIREEYDLICEKGFASYFLIQKMMTDEARRLGPQVLGFGDGSEAVGPGRGSQCGSLVAYCLRLHDIEPIIHDLRFSRFLSPARGGQQMKIRHSLEPQPHSEVQL
jgi:DNA polymerase-3 subunit alpha